MQLPILIREIIVRAILIIFSSDTEDNVHAHRDILFVLVEHHNILTDDNNINTALILDWTLIIKKKYTIQICNHTIYACIYWFYL